ncbi:hypothetical protein LCGC14_1138980 [marine sediment metagenome]|uniref:Uncharacterized protein n=1 Tax=marine sediment metagenome TaxID=412755 RepID=A0A0F9LYY8_9ZZZZ
MLAAQKAGGDVIYKAVFTKPGETTRAYSHDTTNRQLPSTTTESDWLQNADVIVDNRDDGNLTDLDLTGFQCVVSLGYNTGVARAVWQASNAYSLKDVVTPTTLTGQQFICTTAGTSHSSEPTFPTDLGVTVTETGGVVWTNDGNTGDEYSPMAPLKVIAQSGETRQDEARVTFACAGLANQMEQDEASVEFSQDELSVSTVKTLIGNLTDSVASFAPFSHTEVISTSYGDEDGLIDTYKPKETYHVSSGASRASTVQGLLGLSRMVPRFEDDGNLHIDILVSGDADTWTASTAYIVGDTVIPTTPNDNVYKCTTAGTSDSSEPTFPTTEGQTVNDNTVVWTLTYDFQYNSDDGEHQFWETSSRKRLVIPNKSTYKSHPSHIPQFSGSATDATDFAKLPLETFHQVRLESNAQGAELATAEIARVRADAEQSALHSPPNVGQEVWDLVRITDNWDATGKVTIANVRAIERSYGPGLFETTLRFGFGPAMAPLGISNPGIGADTDTFEADVAATLDAVIGALNNIIAVVNKNTLGTRITQGAIVRILSRLTALEQGGGLTNLDDLTVKKLTVTDLFQGTAEEL